MSKQKPVVVYAASGYTGRLACESLTKLGIPFVAAGRSLERLENVTRAMKGLGADCEARVAEHTPRGLRDLFRGAKVVINISGPFSLLGHAVVDAALVEGCHYLDSTGEQDFMLDVRREYGAAFEQAKLALAPSTAYLWAPGTAAAELCLETPGIDSLKVVYAPPSLQTVASLQSMLRSARRSCFSIARGQLALLPPSEVARQPIPGGEPRKALRTGGGEATFFLGNPRVRNCDTWFANETLARAAKTFGIWNGMSRVVSGDALDRLSDTLVLKFKKDPPAEEQESGRFVIAVEARGGGNSVQVVLSGTSPYVITGFLCAAAAQDLLAGKARRFGYASLAQVFGARHVLSRLEEVGTKAQVEVEGRARASLRAEPRNSAGISA
ncbi:MAG TPA: DUF5938 domain-containing protein [Polyangiaceae bacterium]|nr:DUF5938 domain-containing protein [Polyangiaceae bacterium]